MEVLVIQLFEALNNAGDGAFVVDENLRIIYWNDAAEEILNFDGGVMADQPCYRILMGYDEEKRLICKKRCQVAELALKFKPVSDYDVRMHTKKGNSRWLNMSIFVDQMGENGDNKVIVHLFRDINDKKEDEIFLHNLLEAARKYHSLPSEIGTEPEILLGDLTQRECEVLTLLAQGHGTREIGNLLSISTNTVRNHIQHILEKLQVHSRLEAVAFALKNHVVG
jgi:PAS domain S-box-containing protein